MEGQETPRRLSIISIVSVMEQKDEKKVPGNGKLQPSLDQDKSVIQENREEKHQKAVGSQDTNAQSIYRNPVLSYLRRFCLIYYSSGLSMRFISLTT